MLLLFLEQHWCNKGHFTKSIKVTLKMFRVWAEEKETMLMVLRLLIWHIHFPIGRFSYSKACTLLTEYKVGRHSANVTNNRTILYSGSLQNNSTSKHNGKNVKINTKLRYYIFLLDVKTRQIVVLENLGLGSLQL